VVEAGGALEGARGQQEMLQDDGERAVERSVERAQSGVVVVRSAMSCAWLVSEGVVLPVGVVAGSVKAGGSLEGRAAT
jgi:hypothetical protein